MTRTEDLLFSLDKWVAEREAEGLPMNEILDTLEEYVAILEDLDVAGL